MKTSIAINLMKFNACLMTSVYNMNYYYDPLSFNAVDPPASILPAVLRVTAESDATFMATEYSAALFPQYTWFFNDDFILGSNPKYSGQFTRNLTILNAQESDAGNYKCVISVGGASGQAIGQFFVCELTIIITIPASSYNVVIITNN